MTAALHLRAALGLALTTAVSFLLGVALILALVLALPAATGHQSLTVLTGSMEPTLDTGSVVIDEVIAPTEARIGDIVTFTDPANKDRLITHRLRAARVDGDTVRMVTKGDANDTVERWNVPVDGEIGRVILNVSMLGHAQALLGSRTGYLVLMVGILLLGMWVLVDVWRKPSPSDTVAGRA